MALKRQVRLISVVLAVLRICYFTVQTPGAIAGEPRNRQAVPVNAPMMTDTISRTGATATTAVVRILCTKTSSVGTGFMHKSGRVITAAHVTAGCAPPEVTILDALGLSHPATAIVTDAIRDLALITVSPTPSFAPLSVASTYSQKVGTPVVTWGYPAGYTGLVPLLSVGHIAGTQTFRDANDDILCDRLVVNAAFNGGNSGGPLIDVETGLVIGVVSSKLAPLPSTIESALKALEDTKPGIQYPATRPDGSKLYLSEAKLLGMVLTYLRSQLQLVIGYSVTLEDLKAFLRANGIDP